MKRLFINYEELRKKFVFLKAVITNVNFPGNA